MADSTFANLTTATAPAAAAILPMVASPFGVGDDHKITFDTVFTQLELTTTDGGLVVGGVAAPGVSAAGKAKIYFDSTSNVLNLSQNGAAYSPFTLGGGQTNRLTYWQDAKTVTTFAELQRTSDGALQFNAIAAPSVSAAAKATVYFDTADNQLKLSRNGGSYAAFLAGVGTIDSVAKVANGATVSANAIVMQTADASAPGLVSTGTQTFAGQKTFNGQIIANRATAAGSSQVALTIAAPSGGLVTAYAALGSASGTGGYVAVLYDATTGYVTHGFWNTGDWLVLKSDPTYPYAQIKNEGGGTRDIVLGSDGTFGASGTLGFVWLPAVNGTPSGVPTGVAAFGYGNTCPTIIDRTNYLWYAYVNGAWRNLTGVYPSSIMNLNSIAVASGSASVTTYSAFTYQQASSGNLSLTAANAAHTAALLQGTASQSAAILVLRQNATPGTGAFLDCQSSAPASLFTLDSNGQISTLRGVAYTWPSAQGAASTVLTNDGAGNLSWAAGGGGGGTPGGANTQVQYNNSGAFGGITNATTNGTTLTITSPKIVTSILDTNGNTLFAVTPTASAVNNIEVINAATGNSPRLRAAGSDANIDLILQPKGAARYVQIRGNEGGGTPTLNFWNTFGNFSQGNFTGSQWTAGQNQSMAVTTYTANLTFAEYTSSGSYDIYIDKMKLGVNKTSSLGAQLHVVSNSASRVGLEVDSASASTVALTNLIHTTNQTNAVATHSQFYTRSSGTAATGLGGQLLFGLESSTTDDQNAASIDWLWTNATHANRTSALVFNCVNSSSTLTEVMRLTVNGAGVNVPSGIGAMLHVAAKNSSGVAFQADSAASPTDDIARFTVAGTVAVKVTKYGSMTITGRQTAPALGDLIASAFEFFLDEAGNNLKVRVLYSDGSTLKTGTVALV